MCLFPNRAELQEFGRPKFDPEGSTLLPCGKCVECISKRAIDWALRARHEISIHDENCFITLTYDDENLPSYLIVKEEFQKFMKKLRKQQKTKLRYMVSHEYGGKTGRPHHHAIIFGYNPSSQRFLKEAPSGEPLFTSPELDKLWTHGFHSIGTANERTAYYIASYSLKSSKHTVLNPTTGELETVTDSMDASKRPAIGATFFYENIKQLIDSKTSLPRYYIKLLETAQERLDNKMFPTHKKKYKNSRLVKPKKLRKLIPYIPTKKEITFAKNAHLHLQEYQNNQKIIPRSDQQKHAKYVITLQQKNLVPSTYRQTPDSIQSDKHYQDHLITNRDNYVSKTKGKK